MNKYFFYRGSASQASRSPNRSRESGAGQRFLALEAMAAQFCQDFWQEFQPWTPMLSMWQV